MDSLPNDVILSGENLELTFGGVKALEALTFQIRAGQIISVIGPNGAGKTCLINCITGYYRPEKGQIYFMRHNITGMGPHRIAQLGISRTFQDPTTYPSMTALEILMAARYMHTKANIFDSLIYFGRSRKENLASRREVEKIVAFAHIEDLRRIPLAIMSYGQRKQVDVARAMAMQPKVVLLDEPMSGLDDVMKEIMTELIINMYKQGMTIILIEHDMQVVMELSHAIIVLDHGQKIAEGSPDQIIHNKTVAEAYLGAIGREYLDRAR